MMLGNLYSTSSIPERNGLEPILLSRSKIGEVELKNITGHKTLDIVKWGGAFWQSKILSIPMEGAYWGVEFTE